MGTPENTADNAVSDMLQQNPALLREYPDFDFGWSTDDITQILNAHPDTDDFNAHKLLNLALVFRYESTNGTEPARVEFPLHYLSTNELMDLIGRVFFEFEELYMRGGDESNRLGPDAKIIFLIGTEDTIDLTVVRDFQDRKIYSRILSIDRVKTPELPEAQTSISDHHDLIQEMVDRKSTEAKPLPLKPWSEIADIVYNVVQLCYLDKNNKAVYTDYLNRIADSIDFSLWQLLVLTAVKYNYRFGFGKSRKDIHIEHKVIEALVSSGQVMIVSDPMVASSNLKKTSNVLTLLSKHLEHRFDDLYGLYILDSKKTQSVEPSKQMTDFDI